MKQPTKIITIWAYLVHISLFALCTTSVYSKKVMQKPLQTSGIKKETSTQTTKKPSQAVTTFTKTNQLSQKKNKVVELTPRKNLYKRMVPPKKPQAPPVEIPQLALSPEEKEYKEQLIKKTIQYMNEDELREAKKYAELINGDKYLISQYIERLLILSNDQKEKQDLRFELANYYFDKQDMKKAASLFREYIRLYPGSPRRDEVEYKEILSRFHARFRPPRDQSKTAKVLRLATNYLENAKTQKRAYTKEIKELQHICQEDLFSHEYDIAYQYMIRKQFKAAETRLAYIRSELLSYLKEKEPIILELEIAIAQQQTPKDHTDEIKQKLTSLQSNWPMYKPTLFAYEKTYKKPALYKRA